MHFSRKAIVYLALIGGILCLSLSSLFIRWSQAPGVVTSFFRVGIATSVMAPFFLPKIRSIKLTKALLLAPLLGGIFSALDQAVWSTSIGLTRVANATLLNNTAPLWVALVAWLIFHERLNRKFWLGLALALIGAFIVLGNDIVNQPSLSWGDGLALISGIIYAGYFLAMQRGRENLSPLVYMGLVNTFSCLTLFAICLIFHQPLTGFPASTYLVFLGAALISQITGHLFLSYAMGHLSASIVSPTMIAQPVLTAVMAIPLLGENLHLLQWIGGAAVLAGIAIVNNQNSKEVQVMNP
jgi:drug/metabolite transporter (DMT)-like permease